MLSVQGGEHVGEIDAARHHAKRRHDDVIDYRLDDRGEGRADNDADRHVDDVAFESEFLEFL